MDAHFHTRAAFHYSCWDVGAARCRGRRQTYRDCKYDRDKLYYRRKVRLPAVYPDGLYVLGFAWWGGLDQGKGFNAALGDYYDCRYVGADDVGTEWRGGDGGGGDGRHE